MSEKSAIIKAFRESPGIRTGVLFGTFFFLLSVTSFISLGIDRLPFGTLRDKGLATSAIQNLLAFCLPAIALARFCSREIFKWLKLNSVPNIRQVIGVVLVYILSLPAMEWIIDWNQNIHFPEALATLETKLRAMEASASAISNTLLNTDSFIGVLVGVCIIGILTGFSEELFFRGGLLGIMDRTQMSKDLAVWSVAVIFSFLHFQFFGFFPRLLMGAFFGYLFIWSRNLWVPIFGHVLNNSLVVATAPFFMEFGSETTSEVSFGLNSEFPFLALASLTITILFFIFFRCYFFKTTSNKESLWQKNHLPPISGK